MSLLGRFHKYRPPGDGPVLCVRRSDISAKRLFERGERGWPRDLQVVRKALPEHLHNSPPPAPARRGLWLVAAKVDGLPVGLAWAVPSAGEPTGAYIEEVAVLESHRGRGISTQLLREIARWMLELGRPDLSILPMTGSHWVVKAGFRRVDGGTYVADAQAIT